MATWVIEAAKDGTLSVRYIHHGTGETHTCGALRPDTPLDLVVEWILTRGEARPGDWVVMPDGEIHCLSQPGSA